VLVRRKLPPPAASWVYELTPWGYESQPIFQAMSRWAARSPAHEPTLPFSAVSLFLSFRTMLDPVRARGIDARIGFRIGEQSFVVRLAGGRLDASREPLGDADPIFTGTVSAIAAVVHGGQPLTELEAAGVLSIEGDRALADGFVTLFPLPPKAEPPG
jgi:hypothetical protein